MAREVISLKKYLEFDNSKLVSSILRSYRSALVAIGNCSVQVCPGVGSALQERLSQLEQRLTDKVDANVVAETGQQVNQELQQWGEKSAEYLNGKANEVKELLIVLARTAESVGERDERYANQFNEFTSRLRSIANLDDLTQVRSSLVRSAQELKTCIDKMTQDGAASVAKLKAEVSTYQAKLEHTEELASRDSLTRLENRRSIESQVERRIAHERPFSVVMLDLDGFKQVNDTCGHLAGDDLLKQFATELRSASRATDLIGRWGGDEFIVVLDCGLEEAKSHIARLERWVFGDYTVQVGDSSRKVHMGASIGLSCWQKGETLKDVLGRADAAMYQNKAASKR